MNKGVLYIPEHLLTEAFEKIVADYEHPEAHQKNYYALSTVMITPEGVDLNDMWYYFFCEFDFPSTEVLDDQDHRRIGAVIAKTLAPYTSKPFFVYGSSKMDLTEPTTRFPNVHFHTKILMQVRDAKRVYSLLDENLEKYLPRKDKSTKWSDIVDVKVVSDGKINCRPNRAIKYKDCVMCAELKIPSEKVNCRIPGCNGRGYTDFLQLYVLSFVLDRNGVVNMDEYYRLRNNMVEELKMTHFIPPSDVSDEEKNMFKLPEHVPCAVGPKARRKRSDGEIEIKEAVERLPRQVKTVTMLPESSDKFRAMAMLAKVQDRNPWWRKSTMYKVKQYYDKKTDDMAFIGLLKGEGANFCENHEPDPTTGLQHHHSANRVGIKVTRNGWTQICLGSKLGKVENRVLNPVTHKRVPCENFEFFAYESTPLEIYYTLYTGDTIKMELESKGEELAKGIGTELGIHDMVRPVAAASATHSELYDEDEASRADTAAMSKPVTKHEAKLMTEKLRAREMTVDEQILYMESLALRQKKQKLDVTSTSGDSKVAKPPIQKKQADLFAKLKSFG